MRQHIFHLAIPCRDLDETVDYYVKLGCQLARRYSDRVTFNFFGDQVVCHLNPDKIDQVPMMYPRHFGLTFTNRQDYDLLLEKVMSNNLEFFKTPFSRFEGQQEEHLTFFLKDPSNNLIEVKYYHNVSMIY